MSAVAASPITSWAAFWMQLPIVVVVLAVAVVALTALHRARDEDVPRVFAAFIAGFGRGGEPPRPRPEEES